MSSRPTIDDIPYELINEVLKLVILQHDASEVWSTFGESRTTLLLVSRRWNDIIIKTPAFWNVIRIHAYRLRSKSTEVDNEPHKQHVLKLDQIRAAALRSGTLPRRLHLNSSNSDEERLLQGIVNLIQSITNWTFMSLQTWDHRLVQQIFSIEEAPLQDWSALSELRIHKCWRPHDVDVEDPGSNGTNGTSISLYMSPERFPSLREVMISEWWLKICQLPWAQLTDLDLALIPGPFSDCLEVLEKSSSLERLKVRVNHHVVNSDPFKLRHITLHKLQDLELDLDRASDVIPSFLFHLTLPSLINLSLKEGVEVYHPHFLTRAALQLVQRSGAKLQYLDIRLMTDIDVEERDEIFIATLLKVTPSLRMVCLGAAHITGLFLTDMDDHCLPNLTHLYVDNHCRDRGINDTAAQTFVEWVKRRVLDTGDLVQEVNHEEGKKVSPRKFYYCVFSTPLKDFPCALKAEVAKLRDEGCPVTLDNSLSI
ncbi:hypothetical protein D9611_014052 [Ephemerocybe angulata]|uniref:F-box domain-containing protein n=1 Tax=Ephemerocybe angulata TaxID=980116 RepID=A0A8H5ARM6_9AGAR|nr:hypothetical protein D9611_014052 [Tulosesus angulatus]